MNEWIKVTDRLPEAKYGDGVKAPFVSDDVAVYFDEIGVDIANYDHDAGHWTLPNKSFEQPDCNPTHWKEIGYPK